MATFVVLNWLVDLNSPRVREDIPIGIVVIVDRSVTLEIFLEPTWEENAVATSKLPPGVGFVGFLLLRRSAGAM